MEAYVVVVLVLSPHPLLSNNTERYGAQRTSCMRTHMQLSLL